MTTTNKKPVWNHQYVHQYFGMYISVVVMVKIIMFLVFAKPSHLYCLTISHFLWEMYICCLVELDRLCKTLLFQKYIFCFQQSHCVCRQVQYLTNPRNTNINSTQQITEPSDTLKVNSCSMCGGHKFHPIPF